VLVHNTTYGHIDYLHIIIGNLTKKGKAVGFHHSTGELAGNAARIPGTKGPVNQFGAFVQKVEVQGVAKTSNGGYSSFFPDSWSAARVVKEIDEVSKGPLTSMNKTKVSGVFDW